MFGLRHRGSSTTGLDDHQVRFDLAEECLSFPQIWIHNFSANRPSEGRRIGGRRIYGGGEGPGRDLRVLHENSR